MIEEGKDKLEWYRQVDPTKLSTLKDLINAPNYKDNLGTLIKTIYEFAFLTYSGTPECYKPLFACGAACRRPTNRFSPSPAKCKRWQKLLIN